MFSETFAVAVLELKLNLLVSPVEMPICSASFIIAYIFDSELILVSSLLLDRSNVVVFRSLSNLLSSFFRRFLS